MEESVIRLIIGLRVQEPILLLSPIFVCVVNMMKSIPFHHLISHTEHSAAVIAQLRSYMYRYLFSITCDVRELILNLELLSSIAIQASSYCLVARKLADLDNLYYTD